MHDQQNIKKSLKFFAVFRWSPKNVKSVFYCIAVVKSLTLWEDRLSHKQYTGCPRRNVKYFGRVFLMLNYTDITQNTYIQS